VILFVAVTLETLSWYLVLLSFGGGKELRTDLFSPQSHEVTKRHDEILQMLFIDPSASARLQNAMR
jgi:hypothetical protein